MKKANLLLFVLFFTLAFAACKKDPVAQPHSEPQKHFLIDKIYNYYDSLIAEYIYDDQNRLIKRITMDGANKRYSDYEFEYEGDKLKHIRYIDHTFPSFNHNFILYYNELGQIIRDETYQYGRMISYRLFAYNEQGKLKAFLNDHGAENYRFIYNDSSNVIQSVIRAPGPHDSSIVEPGDTLDFYRNFRYDDHPKPDFGLGNQFQVEALPYFGTIASPEANLSKNNMLEFIGSGTKWEYTYNEYGLPATIQTFWEGIETEPMILKLKYKEIEPQ